MVSRSKSDLIFDICNFIFIVLFSITAIYPLMYIFSLSMTGGEGASSIQAGFIPRVFSMENYKRVLSAGDIWSGYANTLQRTILGTLTQVTAIILTAYPLSKRYFPHRSKWTAFIVFTMFFSGGLIPNYLLVKGLGLGNSVWAMILPGLIPTYTMIITRNFFMDIPPSLEESARVDGADDFRILWQIILPISKPIIATISLWQIVAHWNAWFDCLLYITDAGKQVLQVILRRIVLLGTQSSVNMENSTMLNDFSAINPESVKAATIMVATLPIILVYPFVQRYFVKGVMVGSLKG